MRRCIELARLASATGDSPVGSVVVDDSEFVSEGVEAVRARNDATAHAEIEALRAAFARRRSRALAGCTLYTSVEPCVMCASALRLVGIGVIIASIVNIFLASSALYWLVTIAGVLVFVGLTAYDTQKIKNLAAQGADETGAHRLAITGALALYLDFINLFLLLLRIFGRR